MRCDLRCHKSMRLYLIIVQDRDKVSTVSNGTNCKLIVSAIHRYYFQWPWATPNPDFPWHSRAYALSLRAGTVFNWLRHVKKCLCHRLGNIQCGFRSSSWGSTYPQAQSIQPNCWSDMPTPAVQVWAYPPSSACAAIYGVIPHVHISNTPSSTNVIVELDGLLQASISALSIIGQDLHALDFKKYIKDNLRFWQHPLKLVDASNLVQTLTMASIIQLMMNYPRKVAW